MAPFSNVSITDFEKVNVSWVSFLNFKHYYSVAIVIVKASITFSLCYKSEKCLILTAENVLKPDGSRLYIAKSGLQDLYKLD